MNVVSRYEKPIYRMLSDEFVTPNEVALKQGITQKTAQRVLMLLVLTRDDEKYKNSGRIHLFWMEPERAGEIMAELRTRNEDLYRLEEMLEKRRRYDY